VRDTVEHVSVEQHPVGIEVISAEIDGPCRGGAAGNRRRAARARVARS
jgi:hypothetical protein